MYALYNRSRDTYLTHPAVGLWFTESKEEADDMLKACHDYLHAYKLDFMIEDISVVNYSYSQNSSSPRQ